MDEVMKLVEENPHLEISKDDSGKEKVRCKLTGHQLPCRPSAIINYTKGKKYQRLLKGLATHDKAEKDDRGMSLEEYKQYLVPAEKNRNQLYCKVTKKLINDIPCHIELHVKGKRFQRALKKYEESKSDETANGEGELNVWVPPEEPSSEPKIDTLPDSFGEDSDDDEEEMDQEAVEDENDDADDEVNEKNKKKESNSDKMNKHSKKKLQGSINRDKKYKQSNTRKRSLKEEPSKQKEITKKIKKPSKSKVSLGKNLRRSKRK